MARTPGSRWRTLAASDPAWIEQIQIQRSTPPVQVECHSTDLPGHMHGGRRPDGWRCARCVKDWPKVRAGFGGAA